jgi:hypothetical protein
MDRSDDVSNEDSKFCWRVVRKGSAAQAAIEDKVGRVAQGDFRVR